MKILFICEGNINRSQMAGTIFKSLVTDAEVMTAGVYADHDGELLASIKGGPIAFMSGEGYDMSASRVTQLTQDMLSSADKVVLLGPIPGGPIPAYVTESKKLEVWDVPDPGYGQISLSGAYEMIDKYVRKLATQV